jgi:hypothetical protein
MNYLGMTAEAITRLRKEGVVGGVTAEETKQTK